MNLITELNFCKSKKLDVDKGIVIDVLSTYMFNKILFNEGIDLNKENSEGYFSNVYPNNSDEKLINVHRNQHEYIQSFLRHYDKHEFKVNESQLIDPIYYNDSSPIRFTNFNDSIFNLTNYSSLNINFNLLKKHFTILNRYSPYEFLKIVASIQGLYNIEEYKYKYFDIISNKFICKSIEIKDARLFVIDNKSVKMTKVNDKITNIEVDLNFNTLFGNIFIQNLLSITFNIINPKMYELLKLKSRYPYIIYKCLILPYYGSVNTSLSIDKLKSVISYKSYLIYNIKRNTNKYFQAIQDVGLIDNIEFKLIDTVPHWCYSRKRWKPTESRSSNLRNF